MSVMTTGPGMAACAPSTSGLNGSPLVERRQNGGPDDSPMDILLRMPALVVLERLSVPALAMAQDGLILFVNRTFAEMVGYDQDALAGLVFPEVFRTVPAVLCALAGVDAVANLVVELRHREGWTVRARMSESAMRRRDDPVVLVTFDNLTEQLWTDER